MRKSWRDRAANPAPGVEGARERAETRPRLRRWLAFAQRRPVLFSLVMIGAILVAGVPATDAVDLYFSSLRFCGDTCHVMRQMNKEYQESTHFKTPTGVRATCADCHVSRRITLAMWGHFLGMRELFVFLTNDFSKPETWARLRPEAADDVRMGMLANDSMTCRQCHVMEGIQPERRRGKRQHKKAVEEGTTCIACHYNLVHKEVDVIDGTELGEQDAAATLSSRQALVKSDRVAATHAFLTAGPYSQGRDRGHRLAPTPRGTLRA